MTAPTKGTIRIYADDRGHIRARDEVGREYGPFYPDGRLTLRERLLTAGEVVVFFGMLGVFLFFAAVIGAVALMSQP